MQFSIEWMSHGMRQEKETCFSPIVRRHLSVLSYSIFPNLISPLPRPPIKFQVVGTHMLRVGRSNLNSQSTRNKICVQKLDQTDEFQSTCILLSDATLLQHPSSNSHDNKLVLLTE